MHTRLSGLTPLLLTTFLFAAAAAGRAHAQQAAPSKAPATAPADARHWDGNPPLRIAWDPSLEIPSPESLEKEILGPALDAAAAATGAITPSAEARQHIKVAITQWPFEITLLTNAGGLSEPKRSALVATYNTLYKRIPALVAARAQQLRREKVMDQQDRLEKRRSAVRELEEKQRQLEHLLRKEAGLVDVTADGVRASLGRLEQEKQRIALDLAGQKARQRAIEEALANLAKRAEARVEQDPIAAELQKIVAAREKDMERVRQLANDKSIAASEVDSAGVALAEAKAKLLERREVAARREAGDLLDTLNRELLMLSINNAEQTARLEFIEQSLARFKDAVQVLDQIADLEREKKHAQADVDEARAELLRRRELLESAGQGPAVRE